MLAEGLGLVGHGHELTIERVDGIRGRLGHGPEVRQEILLAVAGGVFVWEAVSVILQVGSYKTRGGKRVFLIAPYHHHLQFKGWPESRVVMSFWIGTAVCGVVALGLQRVL